MSLQVFPVLSCLVYPCFILFFQLSNENIIFSLAQIHCFILGLKQFFAWIHISKNKSCMKNLLSQYCKPASNTIKHVLVC